MLVGRSSALVQRVALIERMARFDAPVLVQGETGTGKEMAARAIHYLSGRRDAPFVPLNCGAIPEALIESELFGCERGAFTDARQARTGLVSAAEGGTLFLDELDALSPRSQVALLRFLQDHHYRPVGSSRERVGNIRAIAAASPRLPDLLARGLFRDDLAFRLSVLTLDMPPLRERPGDPTLLAEHFIARHARHYGIGERRISRNSIEWLESYAWPGNVRELDNLVQRTLMLSDDVELHFGTTLSPSSQAALVERATRGIALSGPPDRDATESSSVLAPYQVARDHALEAFERDYLKQLMQAASGNVTHAARLAGKERRALGKMLKKHGLDRSAYGTC